MQEFAVVLPLEPLEVGTRVDRAAWPLHVTLVTNLRVEDGLDTLVETVRRFAASCGALATTVEGTAVFGIDRDVVVDLVRRDDLIGPHLALLDALEHALDVTLVHPPAFRDGHRPHVTRTSAGRVHAGDPLRLPTVAVVEILGGTAVVMAAFRLGSPAPPGTTAEAAARICESIGSAGVRARVIGGWGVDALLGEQHREHHDLDLLVPVDDLALLMTALPAADLVIRSVWSENRWIRTDGRLLPSAFVAEGPDGEVDVHVVDRVDGRPVPLSTSTVVLPDGALDAAGRIAGTPVVCATAEAQVVMHTGYRLPPQHRADLDRLRPLLERARIRGS